MPSDEAASPTLSIKIPTHLMSVDAPRMKINSVIKNAFNQKKRIAT